MTMTDRSLAELHAGSGTGSRAAMPIAGAPCPLLVLAGFHSLAALRPTGLHAEVTTATA